jgi:hypothetical protein
MDIRLSAFAARTGCTYTRYADDLVFSWRKGVERPKAAIGIVIEGVKAVLKSEGFAINPKKTMILRKSTRQAVTGLVANAAGPGVPKVRVQRDVIRRLRAAIHNRKRGKGAKEGETLAQLEGMAAWIYMTDPKKGGMFLEQIRALS